MSTTDIILIIGTVTTSIVTIIAALKSSSNQKLLKDQATAINTQNVIADSKLDSIHTLANGTLAAARARIAELESLVKLLTVERDQARGSGRRSTDVAPVPGLAPVGGT